MYLVPPLTDDALAAGRPVRRIARREREGGHLMTIDPDVLARDMAALAADRARVVPFVAAYGERLAAVARHHLGELGRRDLARDHDEVQGLVWDIALVIQSNAGAWRPGGALPWTWAYRPIRSAVAAFVGHARADVEVELLDDVAPPATSADDLDFDAVADRHPLLGLVRQALAEVPAKELHRRVHLEYRQQVGLGDPSPSRTVGAMFGLSEANVRQIDRRVRKQLTAVVATDRRYRALRDIPWLDTGPRSADADPDGEARAA
jgi:DNA-directed RNA polymerase specialized sigma24 family protein